MWQLLKRDLLISWHIIGLSYVLLFIVYLLKLPNDFSTVYGFLFIYCIAIIFYLDRITQMNRFFISIPIKRNKLVMARYLFIFTNYTVFYVIDFFLIHPTNMTFFLLKYTALCILISISLPIYYLFRSIWIQVIAHFVVLALTTLCLFYY